MNLKICNMVREDYEDVKGIYRQGINSGISTFQKEPLEWEEFDKSHLEKCRLVAKSHDKVYGWIALSRTSIMEALRGVVEVSIYVDEGYQRCGIATKLYESLIYEAKKNEIWSLQAIVLPENKKSINLHKKIGFREIGYKEKVAKMPNGIWKNIILFEKRLNLYV